MAMSMKLLELLWILHDRMSTVIAIMFYCQAVVLYPAFHTSKGMELNQQEETSLLNKGCSQFVATLEL